MQMLKKYTLYYFALLGIMVLFNSCKKEYESIESIDDAKIQAYLKQNNISAIKDPSGYYYNVVSPGTGDVLKYSDSVFYSFTFKTLNGTLIDQSSELIIPATYLGYTDIFSINNSVYQFNGVREVLYKLKRGGKAVIILPSYLAFGKNGLSNGTVSSNEIILGELGLYTQSKRHEINDVEINNFIVKNNLTLTKDPSAAYYNVITAGTGTETIKLNSTIKANYTVRYLDGSVLESSTDGTFSSVLGRLYKGWQAILPGKVKAGGKIRLVLPASLGNSVSCLDFDIEIVEVTN